MNHGVSVKEVTVATLKWKWIVLDNFSQDLTQIITKTKTE